ncbi:MAG: ATP-binding cassette domain-containing protein [Ezakiella sp.]|nr:ATP-binding cassette domain-containing protein [Ezakiella sp.]MDD7472080.1 ATP-binding cassette domain-containing protein [Bacillota bacterium]MDY3924043.1 ATP-binding cassette domain-containing protein [Ezakiella sp.]
MIKIENLSKSFKNGNEKYVVLQDCNFNMENGENVLICGENGAGKTTLLKIIGLLDKNFEGSYKIYGENIINFTNDKYSTLRNNMFGIVYQDYFLIDDETVHENIIIPLYYSSKFDKSERNKRVDYVIDFLEMGNIKKKKVKNLSGGERQKVALARAIINEPDVLLLDEPTNALSVNMKQKLKSFLKEYSEKGHSIILISHDLESINSDFFVKYELIDGKLNKIFKQP